MSMFRVSSWKKAVASALDKISSEFSSLPDIVHPFIMGLKEVRMYVHFVIILSISVCLFINWYAHSFQMISGVSSLASIESAIKSENVHNFLEVHI